MKVRKGVKGKENEMKKVKVLTKIKGRRGKGTKKKNEQMKGRENKGQKEGKTIEWTK